jgi:ABC-type sugar transport system ATPase subunit
MRMLLIQLLRATARALGCRPLLNVRRIGICSFSDKTRGTGGSIPPTGIFIIKMKLKISNILEILWLVLIAFFILYGFILHGSYPQNLEYSIPALVVLIMVVQWFEKDKPQDEKPKEKSEEKKRDTFELVYNLFPVLKDRKGQQARTLSGGEQQMLAIGRALMSRPRFMMIDEPSSGLGPKLVDKTMEVIKQLRGEGITILLVEQQIPKALSLCDRGYILEEGRVTLHGTGEELLHDKHVLTAYLGK